MRETGIRQTIIKTGTYFKEREDHKKIESKCDKVNIAINTTGLKNSPHCYPLETETLMSSWERSRERFTKSGSGFDLPTFVSIASINWFDSRSRVLKVF